MRNLFAAFLALTILTVGSRAVLLAHEGHEHKVMGTVTMAAADHVMLKDKDGKDVMVKVTKDTKVKAKPTLKWRRSRRVLESSSRRLKRRTRA